MIAYGALGGAGGLASLVLAGGIAALPAKIKSATEMDAIPSARTGGSCDRVFAVLGAPQIMGAGYGFIEDAMQGKYTWEFLGILAGLKILSTTISFTSGTPGWMFAPTLFIGARLGASVAGIEHALLPYLPAPAATYAIVGPGVLFAGFLRAPMTSVFMVLEGSGNYSIILPVIVANTIAYVILRVEDAIRPFSGAVPDADLTVSEAAEQAKGFAEANALIRISPGGWYILTTAELSALVSGHGESSLRTLIPSRHMPYLHPDHSLEAARRYVDQWAIIPVVNRANFNQLEGVISKQDVLMRYQELREDD